MSWWSELRERLSALLHRERVDAETAEEMRFHLEMAAEERVRSGASPADAKRQAALAFGGMERHQEEVRDARGFGVLNGLSLDVKLGGRMMGKYPGLTIAGVLALAVAVALASSWYEFSGDVLSPVIPVPEGERLVVVANQNRVTGNMERRGLHDFELWREELRSVTELSAVARAEFSVVTATGRFAFLRGVRMTGAGLRAARVQPILGRVHIDSDQERGSALPVVIGYDVWQQIFDGDRAVIGQSVRINEEPGVVVGVMPEKFAFPANQQVWVPLREQAKDHARGEGPPVTVYGRLARGATMNQAEAELVTLGARMAEAFPTAYRDIRPKVRRAGDTMGAGRLVGLVNVPFILFLVVVCANVATLVFARTVARSGELALRSALGASRRRLVLQLIAEALVLTGVGTALGLAVTHWGMRWGMNLFWEVQQEPAPFWSTPGIELKTVLYGLALAVLAASIIGGIPALKATGRRLSRQLSGAKAGASGMRFGPVSTAVIVVQVALCVAFLPVAIEMAQGMLPDHENTVALPADEFLAPRIVLATDALQEGERATDLFQRARQRISEHEAVSAVTLASTMPGFNHPTEPIELEGDTVMREARVLAIDADFLTVLGGRVIAGRALRPEDFTSSTGGALVDVAWAQEQLAGRNPVGQRFRIAGRGDSTSASAWREIVGVVDGMDRVVGPGSFVGLYEPLTGNGHATVQAYVRTTRPPVSLAADIHAAVTGVDPRLQLADPRPLNEIWRPVEKSGVFFIAAINIIGAVILGFALIGIYSLMSFTVAQRGREIAIRAALGANPQRILFSIFARAVLQIGLGVLIGAIIVGAATVRDGEAAARVAGVAVAMLLMGLAGCFVPARRALRIQPREALVAE